MKFGGGREQRTSGRGELARSQVLRSKTPSPQKSITQPEKHQLFRAAKKAPKKCLERPFLCEKIGVPLTPTSGSRLTAGSSRHWNSWLPP